MRNVMLVLLLLFVGAIGADNVYGQSTSNWGYYHQDAYSDGNINTPSVWGARLEYTNYIYPYARTVLNILDYQPLSGYRLELDPEWAQPLTITFHPTGIVEFSMPANSPPVVFILYDKNNTLLQRYMFFWKS